MVVIGLIENGMTDDELAMHLRKELNHEERESCEWEQMVDQFSPPPFVLFVVLALSLALQALRAVGTLRVPATLPFLR